MMKGETMHAAFIRQYQAYAEALEGTGFSIDQHIAAMAKTAAVDTRFAIERAEAVLLFDSKRAELEGIYRTDPNAEFKPQALAERLGLPDTRGFKTRIALALKQLRLTDMRGESPSFVG
jgi:hypothetical protein